MTYILFDTWYWIFNTDTWN